MAPPPGTLRVSRYFGALGLILAVLYLLVLLPGNANTPKLGIDLVGGVRVIFTAKPPPGEAVTSNSMDQARQIIEDRINGTGVTASTVQIQGDDQLVVQIPGGTDTDVQRLGQAAQLNFRPLVAPAQQVTCDPKRTASTATPGASASAGPSGSASSATNTPSTPSTRPSSTAATSGAGSDAASGNSRNERLLAAPSPSGSATPGATRSSTASTPAGSGTPSSGAATSPGASASPSASPTQAAPACTANPIGVILKSDPKLTIPLTEAAYGKLTQTQQQEIAAALQNVDCSKTNLLPDEADQYYVACEEQGGLRTAYLLGKVIVKGEQIDEANAVAPSTGGQGGSTEWTVSLTLKDSGKTAWGNWTTAHNSAKQQGQGPTACGTAAGGLPCEDYVAFTLDGKVLSAPVTNEPIVGQATQISGNFLQSSANALADSLKYGALPLSFNLESNERVSASLGTSQLQAALLAGGIGLILVVLYSLLYYRALGLVTIASLVVSGLLTYAMMVILGQQIGFTLDLSGIAGLIVALGITADSFVVFFERIKDEVHEGRSVRVAIPRAWVRARRTVLSADTVSFLAAAILYYFASADVKGFAFTLGLSTILDLVVVFLFTHPIVSLLARSRAFGSPRFTGLNSVRAGGITADAEARPKRAATRRRAAGSTVVLEKDATAEIGAEGDPGDDTVDDTVDGGDVDATEETAAEETPRRRSTPAGGTAAERAAARRARQREKKDEGNA